MLLANLLGAVMAAVCGILIKYLKLYDLIAGYNTMPDEEKKKIDIEALGDFMGNMLLAMAGALVIGAALEYLGMPGAGPGSWILFLVITFYLVIKAQNFKKSG